MASLVMLLIFYPLLMIIGIPMNFYTHLFGNKNILA